MKALDQVLYRIFVKRFYNENTGFFLVLLGVCFGFLKAPQHYEINAALAEQPLLYLIPMVLWFLYAFKAARFCAKVGWESESMMLGSLELLGRRKVFWLTAKVQVRLFLPVLGYGLFMANVALENHRLLSALLVIITLVVFVLALTLWHTKNLLKQKEFGVESVHLVSRYRPRYLFEFYIHYLLSFQGLRVVLMKLLSLLILYISIQVFLDEAIDLRYLTLGVMLSATANSFFSMDYVRFERTDLQFFRNLPIDFLKRSVSFWLTFLVLTIPEILILVGQLSFTISWYDLLSLIFFIPSLLMVFMALAYLPEINQERFTKQVFFLSATLFFVILGHVPAIALIVVGLITSLLLLEIWVKKSEII